MENFPHCTQKCTYVKLKFKGGGRVVLMGEYNYAIDDKGRLNFPARFREQMGAVFVITRWMDHCLVVFPQQEWQSICEKMQTKSMVKTREIQRFLFAMATEVTPDKQGRILISNSLRAHANLQKDVTVIGVGKRAEIWDTASWLQKQAEFGSEELEAAMEELEL